MLRIRARRSNPRVPGNHRRGPSEREKIARGSDQQKMAGAVGKRKQRHLHMQTQGLRYWLLSGGIGSKVEARRERPSKLIKLDTVPPAALVVMRRAHAASSAVDGGPLAAKRPHATHNAVPTQTRSSASVEKIARCCSAIASAATESAGVPRAAAKLAQRAAMEKSQPEPGLPGLSTVRARRAQGEAQGQGEAHGKGHAGAGRGGDGGVIGLSGAVGAWGEGGAGRGGHGGVTL